MWGRGAGGRGPYFDASAMTFAWPALKRATTSESGAAARRAATAAAVAAPEVMSSAIT